LTLWESAAPPAYHVAGWASRLQPFANAATIADMLLMVVEHFRDGDGHAIRERFLREGRMLPAGVSYRDSWIDASSGRCFQLMEAPDAAALEPWTARWNDLVAFEIVPVVSSNEYWAKLADEQ
jgi:Protein of unknown function (DUF3303)